MVATKLGFLAKACGGALTGDAQATVYDVKIDSRECLSGDLFVCVVGESKDGHDYINSAYERGCRCFLVSREIEFEGASFIRVDDTKAAFTKMAEAYLNQFSLRKIAITGSVGKTTTKMLTAAVMQSKYNTISTQKNLNTDLGTCLTAFTVDEKTQAVVFEMGMDKSGEIAGYVSWIKPEVAVITNIGVSHLERLGSRDAIADAKLEIVNEFTDKNVLIVNGDSDYLRTRQEIRDRAKNKSKFQIVSIGKDIELSMIRNDGLDGISFRINDVPFKLPLLGEHNAVDAALAVACGTYYGIPLASAAKALENVIASEKRLQSEKLGGILLIDDSYNASPDSMMAGISALAAVRARRHILILGDMLELGYEDESGHIAVGRFAAENGIDILIAAGNKKDYYRQGISEAENSRCIFIALEDLDAVKNRVKELLRKDDAVLVKGSNSTGISEVAQFIRDNFK